jgi:hypothetical protein
MPYEVRVLHNGDGPVILARGETPASVLELAADEAASNDLVVTDAEADISVGWVRATPCREGGHETRDGFDWCDGGIGTHYAYGKPGPGAFRGAFVNVRYLSRQETSPAAAGTETTDS